MDLNSDIVFVLHAVGLNYSKVILIDAIYGHVELVRISSDSYLYVSCVA